MHKFASEIHYFLEMFRRGDVDDAFHGLLEMDRGILPELMEAFRLEKDIPTRQFLIQIIWEYRDASAIPLLGEALYNDEPCIWQEALNGLVTMACPDSLRLLREARKRQFPTRRETEEFACWLNEAIEQAEKCEERFE
ncbi:MAG: hypothetical protein JWM16_5031 [Verrucomicrobiales bacterium]|nr:hypothetical protein [Verrucomicrobiales bacterium]